MSHTPRMADDLVEFLLARIAEDEEVARAAAGQSPEWVESSEETLDGENVYFTVTAKRGREWEPDYFLGVHEDLRDADRAAHIARHDPARVLAECQAKRRIVEAARHTLFDDPFRRTEFWRGARDVAEGDLRFLALAYAGHPDYLQEWAP